MSEVPVWFNKETAVRILDQDSYNQKYKEYYDTAFARTHQTDSAEEEALHQVLSYAYHSYLALAGVAVERQENYPADNPLALYLSTITGQKINDILKDGMREKRTPLEAFRNALYDLDDESLIALWNQCVRCSREHSYHEIVKTSDIHIDKPLNAEETGKLFYTYGYIYLKDEWTLSDKPVSLYMTLNDHHQYIPVNHLHDYISYCWMAGQIVRGKVDISSYTQIAEAVNEYMKDISA